MRRLEGKTALVTGGGTGIGRATALRFAREGAKVAVAGRRKGPLDDTVAQIREFGGIGLAITADLAEPDQAERVVRQIPAELGGLDVLFNNHGIFERGSVVEASLESWDRTIAVNLRSFFLTCRAAVPVMRGRGGSIINNASTLGFVAIPDAVAYCAAKGGVIQLSRAMALDHADEGIRVNVLCPGVVDSEMWRNRRDRAGRPLSRKEFEALHPMGRLGTPEDVAALALYLASEDSSWMTGSVLTLDGGLTAF